jgi:hypothetical protein
MKKGRTKERKCSAFCSFPQSVSWEGKVRVQRMSAVYLSLSLSEDLYWDSRLICNCPTGGKVKGIWLSWNGINLLVPLLYYYAVEVAFVRCFASVDEYFYDEDDADGHLCVGYDDDDDNCDVSLVSYYYYPSSYGLEDPLMTNFLYRKFIKRITFIKLQQLLLQFRHRQILKKRRA